MYRGKVIAIATKGKGKVIATKTRKAFSSPVKFHFLDLRGFTLLLSIRGFHHWTVRYDRNIFIFMKVFGNPIELSLISSSLTKLIEDELVAVKEGLSQQV